jgi:hypothetical protein
VLLFAQQQLLACLACAHSVVLFAWVDQRTQHALSVCSSSSSSNSSSSSSARVPIAARHKLLRRARMHARTHKTTSPAPLFFLHHHTQHPLLLARPHTPNASWPRQKRCGRMQWGECTCIVACAVGLSLSRACSLTTINDYYESSWLLLHFLCVVDLLPLLLTTAVDNAHSLRSLNL